MVIKGYRCEAKGITDLKTAIVLIAFVVVTPVLALTIISAGVFSSEANDQSRS